MTEYTPTDDEVREDFAYPWEGFKQDRAGRLAAFDRWLAAHDARVRRDAEREALDELASDFDLLGSQEDGPEVARYIREIRDADYPEEEEEEEK